MRYSGKFICKGVKKKKIRRKLNKLRKSFGYKRDPKLKYVTLRIMYVLAFSIQKLTYEKSIVKNILII